MEALEALCSQLSCSPKLERVWGLPGETPGDTCTPGLWDHGTPASRVSGIRGHLHPRPLGSGDTYTPGLWDQDLPFMDDRPTGPVGGDPITTDTVQLWSLHRSVPTLAGLGLGKPQKVREGDRSHTEVGITHTQFTE